MMCNLDDAVWEFKSKLDADGLQVALAPLLHAVLHHVSHHSDQHIQRVQLIPATAGTCTAMLHSTPA